MANITEIREIVQNMTHVFFTPESARDFAYANLGEGVPTGTQKFMPEMDMDFFTEKKLQDELFSDLPDDRELMRIISRIPGFDRA